MRLSANTLRLCAPLLFIGLVLGCVGPKKPTSPPNPGNLTVQIRDLPAKNGAIGGLVWLNPTTLLSVRDAKNKPPSGSTDRYAFGDKRPTGLARQFLAYANPSQGSKVFKPITLTAEARFADHLLPSDLEAVCIPVEPKIDNKHVKPASNTVRVIATESARYEDVMGRLFLIELTSIHINKDKVPGIEWHAKVIGIEELPMDYDSNANPILGRHQVEGIACFKQPSTNGSATTAATNSIGNYTVVLGYRGKHGIPSTNTSGTSGTSGSISLIRNVDFKGDTCLPPYVKTKPIEIAGPMPDCVANLRPGETGEWRDISDLHVKKDGQIWSASTIDVDDRGPFCSKVYRLPHKIVFNHSAGEWQIAVGSNNMKAKAIDGYKIEAIIGETQDAAKFLLGFDNEKAAEGSGIIAP